MVLWIILYALLVGALSAIVVAVLLAIREARAAEEERAETDRLIERLLEPKYRELVGLPRR
jgi:flagellar basal body-associated protein FliL